MEEKKVGVWRGFTGYLRYIWRESKVLYLWGVLFLPAYIAANYIGLYLPKLVMKELENRESMVHFGGSVTGIILLLIFSVFCRESFLVRMERGNLKLVQRMCMDYTKKILYVDYGVLGEPDFVTLRNKAQESLFGGRIGDGNGSEGQLFEFMEKAVRTVAVTGNLILYGYYLWLLSPWLVPLLLVVEALMFLVNHLYGKYEESYAKKQSDAWHKLDYASRKAEDFSMAKDVRLYDMKDWIYSLIEKYCGERLAYKRKTFLWGIVDSNIYAILSGSFYAVFYAFVLSAYFQGKFAGSDIMFYAGLGPAVYQMADYTFSSNVRGMMRISRCFHRFQIYLEYGKDTEERELSLCKSAPCIELKNVSFSYPGAEHAILKNFNLRIEPGERLAVVGINGAGKTTLMKLICGLLHPTEGQIFIDGRDMEEMTAEERYAHFSCAFQDVGFLPLTVGENIAMKSMEKADKEKIWDCLEKAGISEKILRLPKGLYSLMNKGIHEDAVDFSGGQRQKLVLARALYREAGGLILDEPTAALDALAENAVYEKYAEFANGKTSFFVSHRLASTRFCDRIILISGGNVAEMGTHEELLKKKGLYAKMFALQKKYYEESAKEVESI